MNASIEKKLSRISTQSILSGFVIFIAAAALLISLSIVQGGISASRLAQISLTHTALVDFSTCSTLSNTSLADVDGGEVRLASILEDYFYGPDIDTNIWVPGQIYDYGDAITPTITGGSLYINASYLRSVNAMTQSTRIFESRMQMLVPPYTQTAFGDFGFGRDEYPGLPDVSGHNRLFITDDTDQVFANARTNTETVSNTLLSGVDPSAWHIYRIEWGPVDTYYYIDGTSVVSVSMPSTYEPFVWLYTLNPWATVIVDWARVDYYPNPNGQFSSCSFNAGASTDWGYLTWGGSIPAGANVTFETRTSADDSSWTSWSTVGALGAINSPTNRYLQYRASLSTTNELVSPQIDWVTVVDSSYPAPTVTLTPTSTATEIPTSTATETPTSTATETPTTTATETPTTTATETASATSTATETASATSTATETASATSTATETPTSTTTETPTSTATETPTSTATTRATPASTATETPAPTASVTATATGTPPNIVYKFETFLPVTMKNVIGTNIAASWIEFVLNLF